MTNAANLNLINRIDVTGASVRMWSGVDCAPVEWRIHFPQPVRYVSKSCCGSTVGDAHIRDCKNY